MDRSKPTVTQQALDNLSGSQNSMNMRERVVGKEREDGVVGRRDEID